MFLDVVPLNVSFRRALVGIKLVEWNNFVARVANLNIQVGQDRFFLIKNSGELTVNSMYKRVFSSTPKSQKVLQYLSHRMFAACAWSIKCRRKKLIAQFGGKLRDERFKPN